MNRNGILCVGIESGLVIKIIGSVNLPDAVNINYIFIEISISGISPIPINGSNHLRLVVQIGDRMRWGWGRRIIINSKIINRIIIDVFKISSRLSHVSVHIKLNEQSPIVTTLIS